MTLSVYYLPRLSELRGARAIFGEICSGYKLILPAAVVGSVTIYLLRDFIIHLLFTPDFLPMRELFAWQLLGDTLKLGSWLVASVMLGKAMYKLYIVSEIIFAALFYGLTVWFTGSDGLQGVVKAYAVNNLVYWIFMVASIAVLLKSSRRHKPVDGQA
jgi:polysaccharide transporter, PST family